MPLRPWISSRKLLWPVQSTAEHQAEDEARRQEGQRRWQACFGGAQQQHPLPRSRPSWPQCMTGRRRFRCIVPPLLCMPAVWSEGKPPASESF